MHSSTAMVCIALRFWVMSSVVGVLLLSFLMVIVVPLQLSKMVFFFSLRPAGCGKRLCRGWVGSWDFCLSCDAWSLRWLDSGRTLASVWRCSMLVSAVHPVMILSALFWVDWSCLRFDSAMFGDQTVLAYSMTGALLFYRWLGVFLFAYPSLLR